MNKVVTFDFDNTIVMSYMDIESPDLDYKFQGYNKDVINVIMLNIQKGYDVHIVTSRHESKEGMYPDDTVQKHLEKLNLTQYFWPDKVHYTNGKPKTAKLNELGSTLHYDDDMEEHIGNFGGIPIKNPLDFYKDSYIVTKACIFDLNDHILLLRRSDKGKKWDLPGGHIKEIEVERGEQGYLDGLEREVAEETGLILPFADRIGDQAFEFDKKKSHVHVYIVKMNKIQPHVNLDMQDFRENEDYRWVSMDEIDFYTDNSTKVLKKAVEFLQNRGLLTEKEAWYLRRRRKDVKNRKKLIGMGNNKHTGGGKGHSRPKMGSPKSAPPAVGVLEEENPKKKRKIRVKIAKNDPKLDEKRRKKRRKKAKKRRNRGSNWPYIGGNTHDFGDSGGDGGGGE